MTRAFNTWTDLAQREMAAETQLRRDITRWTSGVKHGTSKEFDASLAKCNDLRLVANDVLGRELLQEL